MGNWKFSSSFFFFFFFFLYILVGSPLVEPLRRVSWLRTEDRWIVNKEGQRVKLACVNWPAHLRPAVAEGLSRRPLDSISKQIVDMNFNCVRFTWALFMVTNKSFSSITVRQSFARLGLLDAIAGFEANNPSLLNHSLLYAFRAVVLSLGKYNLMVILDNHISTPDWCCSYTDENGFFGDKYFKPNQWLTGLARIATMFKNNPNVVAMSLRNELRGSKQNVVSWFRYMQKGAEVVHSANTNVLVMLSGLNYDTDLSFLSNRTVRLSFSRKLVLEVHLYVFTNTLTWETKSANEACKVVVDGFMRRAGFLLSRGKPLVVTEFGADQSGTHTDDNRFLNCFSGLAAELDLDWALWTIVGRYYVRDSGLEESYGLFNGSWTGLRNSTFLPRISTLQFPFRGPGLAKSELHKMFFYPLTGQCVVAIPQSGLLGLGSCRGGSGEWTRTTQIILRINGRSSCLQADGLGAPAKLGFNCTGNPTSKWATVSKSRMHLSTSLPNGTKVCLDTGLNGTLITDPCKCLGADVQCDPMSQWFKFVDTTRSLK